MYCINCGTKLKDGTRVCVRCGAVQDEDGALSGPPNQSVSSVSPYGVMNLREPDDFDDFFSHDDLSAQEGPYGIFSREPGDSLVGPSWGDVVLPQDSADMFVDEHVDEPRGERPGFEAGRRGEEPMAAPEPAPEATPASEATPAPEAPAEVRPTAVSFDNDPFEAGPFEEDGFGDYLDEFADPGVAPVYGQEELDDSAIPATPPLAPVFKPDADHGSPIGNLLTRGRGLLVAGCVVVVAGLVALGVVGARSFFGEGRQQEQANASQAESGGSGRTSLGLAESLRQAKLAARAIESSRALGQLEAARDSVPADQLYPRSVTQVATAPGLTSEGSRIPIAVSGNELDGTHVTFVAYVSYDGGGLELSPGTYKIRVVGSPVAADGGLYQVSERTSLVRVGIEGDTFRPTFVIQLKAIEPQNVSDEYLEWALSWLASDTARADTYARLSEAARARHAQAHGTASDATGTAAGASQQGASQQAQQYETPQVVYTREPETYYEEETPTGFDVIVYDEPVEEYTEDGGDGGETTGGDTTGDEGTTGGDDGGTDTSQEGEGYGEEDPPYSEYDYDYGYGDESEYL